MPNHRRDAERSGWQRYKRSPVRLVILAALVLVMLAMAYLLYEKVQREKQQDAGGRPGNHLRL